MSKIVLEATEKTFESLTSTGTVLVDYWAEWCGPCKMIGAHLDKIAEDYKDKLKIIKVNTDENMNICKFLRSVPTFEIYKDGVKVATKVGAGPVSSFVKWIDENI